MSDILSRNLKREVQRLRDIEAGERIYQEELARRKKLSNANGDNTPRDE